MKSLTNEVLETIESFVNKNDLQTALKIAYLMYEESTSRKKRFLERGIPLGNTLEHIQLSSDMIDYLTEKLKNNLVQSEN